MDCPQCEQSCIEFPVPSALREYAPENSAAAAICPTCLRTLPADRGDTAQEFTAIGEFFPTGGAGVALALALGKLDSLALNRTAIERLLAATAREGADALLALDRLAAAGSVQPHFDLDRRRVQIEQLLE
jgi:hypothetical protein